MIKKTQIFFILIVFFGSTTSLPITIHLCTMMLKTDTMICKICMPKNINDNYCEKKIDNLGFGKNSIKNIPCCVQTFNDNKLKDDFVHVINNANNLLSQLTCDTNNFIDLSPINNNSFLKTRMNSPPNYNSNHLYLSHSALLI